MTAAVFAIPGDITQRTGGYIYEATVLRSLNDIGCPTVHLPMPAGFPNPSPAEMAEALAALREIPADRAIILDGFLVGSLDPGGLAGVRAPMIGMVHHPLGLETGLDPARAAFLRANEAAVLRHMAHVVVPSAHTAEVLGRDFGVPKVKISVAPPGFARPTAPPAPVDPPLILSVGLLAPRKGHDTLLAALGQIRDLDWQAEIVGKTHDAAYGAELRAQAEALGLSDRVSFRGELGEAELQARFSAATLFALATRYEGYGMVLGEAMVHGLPIVSCRAGAVPDTVADAGVLVPPGDARGFAEALRRLLTDTPTRTRLAAASKARAASLPIWQDTATIMARTVRALLRD